MIRPRALLVSAPLLLVASIAWSQDATQIVRDAWNHWRGTSSYAEMTMTIHRPTWERAMSMRAWTEGEKKSLVRVTAPARDRGNGTLMDDNNMWTYSPKVNRVIKVPSSMMGQSWMGSDFSNKDVSRADDVIENYTHSVIGTEVSDGLTVYQIEAIPKEDAAVVWGKEILKIREDHVMLEEKFFDQDGVLVKALVASDIREMGGRTIATRQRMQKTEAPDEWTELVVDAADYDIEVADNLFTLSNLRNPRD